MAFCRRVGFYAPVLAILHVPVTYRGAPIEGAEDSLVGTFDHSVLGKRWVYDACTDPIFAAELARTILTGDVQVELLIDTPDGMVVREPVVMVKGSGAAGTPLPPIETVEVRKDGNDSIIVGAGLEMVVRHVLGGSSDDGLPTGSATLTATWGDESAIVAFIRSETA